MDIGLLLVLVHLVGTIFGVGGATMIEVHLNQALKDSLVSKDESAILALDYKIVRVGLILAILSGFGFLLNFKLEGEVENLYSPVLWAKLLIVIIIAINTLLLQARKIGLYWGAAFSFVSWWTAAILGMLTLEDVTVGALVGEGFLPIFSSIIIIYLVAVAIGSVVLHLMRTKVTKKII